MNYLDINKFTIEKASDAFMQCCTSTTWVSKMVASRPYNSIDELYSVANQHWIGLEEPDYLEAFDGHPKIGDVNSLMKKYANTKALAAGEQSGMNAADEQTIKQLSQGNSDYQDKFGFIFIVCATGKSAQEMNAMLQARLTNNRSAELLNAAEEQRKIFHIRLSKLT